MVEPSTPRRGCRNQVHMTLILAGCRLRLLVPECLGRLQLKVLSVIGNTGHLTHEYHAVEIHLGSSSNWERLIVWFWGSHLLDKAPVVLPNGYWSSTIVPHDSGGVPPVATQHLANTHLCSSDQEEYFK
ncbi:hypothetical protein PG995_010610 [Apiospora arundinis]